MGAVLAHMQTHKCWEASVKSQGPLTPLGATQVLLPLRYNSWEQPNPFDMLGAFNPTDDVATGPDHFA